MTSATDNRTTELRKLLEERGIEWKYDDAAYEIEWSTSDGRHCSAMYWKPTFTVLISECTPEQAIAATLGEPEIVRCRDCEHYDQDDEPSEVYPDRYWCDKLTTYMPPDGFCSFGKRKEVD